MTANIEREREPLPLTYARVRRFAPTAEGYECQTIDLSPGDGILVQYDGPYYFSSSENVTLLSDHGNRLYEMYGFVDRNDGSLTLSDGTSEGFVKLEAAEIAKTPKYGSLLLGGVWYEYFYGKNFFDITKLEKDALNYHYYSRQN